MTPKTRQNRAQATAKPHKLVVLAKHAEQRLDNYLFREFKSLPRQLIYRLIRKGAIRVNNKKVGQATKLAEHDEIYIPAVRVERNLTDIKVDASKKLPPVLHSDKNYLIFDKPAGMAVHGGSGLGYGLIEMARHVRNEPDLELAHRLDKDTSGILVLTKKRSALKWFHALLREKKVQKIYRAAVWGQWNSSTAKKITLPLRKVSATKGGKRVHVSDDGLQAITKTKCLWQGSHGAILEIELVTGKTHQARAHLAHVGLPIIGDNRYGQNSINKQLKIKTLCLHAHQLVFSPIENASVLKITSKIPKVFDTIQKQLDT